MPQTEGPSQAAKKRFKGDCHRQSVWPPAPASGQGMIKRTKSRFDQLRGYARLLFKTVGDNIKKYFLPKRLIVSCDPIEPSRVARRSVTTFHDQEIPVMSPRQTRCDLSRQAQESLQGRQGVFPAAARTPSAPPRPRSRRPANMPSAIASARSARFARSGSSASMPQVRPFGMTYSVFINGLSKSGITVDRKVAVGSRHPRAGGVPGDRREGQGRAGGLRRSARDLQTPAANNAGRPLPGRNALNERYMVPAWLRCLLSQTCISLLIGARFVAA